MAGLGFMFHGFPKLFDSGYREGFVEMLMAMGLPNAELLAWVVAVVEFVGGLAILLGIAIHFASMLLTIDMLVALYKVHWQWGFNFMHVSKSGTGQTIFGMPGYEVNLLYIAILLTLMITGPGKLALFRKAKR